LEALVELYRALYGGLYRAFVELLYGGLYRAFIELSRAPCRALIEPYIELLIELVLGLFLKAL